MQRQVDKIWYDILIKSLALYTTSTVKQTKMGWLIDLNMIIANGESLSYRGVSTRSYGYQLLANYYALVEN